MPFDYEVGGQAVLGRQSLVSTPWLTERHGYDPTCGPAGFTRDFSGPVLLGMGLWSARHFVYGGRTLCAGPFNALRL